VQRYALGIQYLGTAYHGWQRQNSGIPTLQQALETAISKVANANVELVAAGRTDKGVHAVEQVAHFDTETVRAPYNWLRGINALTPEDISVSWVQPVSQEFHARFSAQRRVYRYFLSCGIVKPALLVNRAAWVYGELALAPMQRAAEYLLGRHDFSAFRAADCQAKSPVKTLERLAIHQQNNVLIFEAQADGFLMHMVRNLVGVLVAVGRGDYPPEWAQQVLQRGDRRHAGIAMPPQGLYMTSVEYDAVFKLPQASSSATSVFL